MKIKKIIKWKLSRHPKWPPFFAEAESVRYHRYQIEYNRRHEIVCPRYTFADGTYVVLLPWFLIPGRPYPVQIYLYACGLYSSNPNIGQRGVAEATRIKFKLDTFSHSTVSRSFRSFEKTRKYVIENRFGEEIVNYSECTPTIITAVPKAGIKSAKSMPSEKLFPSAADTMTRREAMRAFFPALLSALKMAEIESACKQFVEGWHKKNRRLLL